MQLNVGIINIIIIIIIIIIYLYINTLNLSSFYTFFSAVLPCRAALPS